MIIVAKDEETGEAETVRVPDHLRTWEEFEKWLDGIVEDTLLAKLLDTD